MEAIRKIKKVNSDEIKIKVPSVFLNKEVEVIILPVENKKRGKADKNSRLLKIYKESKGKLGCN